MSRYVSTLNPAQKKRMDKIYGEPLFLLTSPNEPLDGRVAAMFSVSGSTGTPHSVSVNTSGRAQCSCQDFRINSRKSSCVCKHICFVLVRVMGFTDLSFFRDGLLLPTRQVKMCEEVATGRARYDTESSIATVTREACAEAIPFYTPEKEIIPDEDDCPVCYNVLIKTTNSVESSQQEHLIWCPDCKNAIHEDCMARWKRSCRVTTCVICRSACWKTWKPRTRPPGGS